MILLDSNVISEAEPHQSVRDWLDAQSVETLYLSSITLAERMFGIGALPRGKRKAKLATAFDGVLQLFEPRILPFDTEAARHYADLAVKARAAGRGSPHPTATSLQSQQRIGSPWRRVTQAPSTPPASP